MAKMNRKWIALCSAAIGAIYTADYYITEPVANAVLAQPQFEIQQTLQTAQTQSTQIPKATPPTQSSPSKQPMQSTSSASTTQQKQPQQEVLSKGKYKDGTYTGKGSNRRGTIEVAVTIKNDKIKDVEISHFAMHYSISDVVGLPNEVIQKQSAKVDNVSGATYSTRAFQDAIQEALTLAQNV